MKKKLVIVTIIVFSAIVLSLLAYFVGYPLVSYWTGNYSVYINMYKVSHFTVPDGTKELKELSIWECESLIQITIPDSVTTISYGAIQSCENLEYIRLGSGVNDIQLDSLYTGCLKVSYIEVARGNQTYASVDGILYTKDMSGLLCYPGGRDESTLEIPDSVEYIGFLSFCPSLKTIKIPSSVINYESGAFGGCKNLETIYYDGSMEQWEEFKYKNYLNENNVTIHCTDGTIHP